MEHGLRRALLALWLGEDLGLSAEELQTAYYVALLGTVGCTIEAAALAEFFKDEIAFVEHVVTVDPTRQLSLAAFFLSRVGEGDPPVRRARKFLTFARAGPGAIHAVCRDVALQIGEVLDIGPEIRQGLAQCHERWDGKGHPMRLRSDQLSLGARLFHLAHDVEIFNRLGGAEAAVTVARQRAGKIYDPRIAERFSASASAYLRRLESEATWDTLLASEPHPVRMLSADELDAILVAIADFVDLRSPYTFGHSRGVATVAESGARQLGLSDADTSAVRRAALVHDIGRVGVPVTLWNKSEKLTDAEWERMKGHPALTELLFARSSALGPLGTLAGLHHERLDGTGYRGVPASFQPIAAQVLAVADAYRSKLEPRPHRSALTADEAASAVRQESKQGRLDRRVVDAVLDAAGHASPRDRSRNPADLTDREMDVLRLVVRGLSNREMANALVLSPKTVGRHVEHIYDKIGVSTRVGATLFALQNGLADSAA